MGKQYFLSGTLSGFQYGSGNIPNQGKNETNLVFNKRKEDDDLIIEENTVYEIDRECYERLKRQKRRRSQDRKNI